MKSGKLQIKPYARLLTMIGDHLIKNEQIALLELVKNSYDADANWVQIRFFNFKNNENILISNKDSYIEIEDDGVGMDFHTIENNWMNPASPNKYLLKEGGKNVTTKNRIIQGEKGIGRFAIYKIGATFELITKKQGANASEILLKGDLSIYDEEVIRKKNFSKLLFLDEIKYEYEIRDNPLNIIRKDITVNGNNIKRSSGGTLIKISNLKIKQIDIGQISESLGNLQSPFGDKDKKNDFIYDVLIDGKSSSIQSNFKETFDKLLEDCPLRVEKGFFNANTKNISFLQNKLKVSKDLNNFNGDTFFKKRFKINNDEYRDPKCGSFSFSFYVFEFGHDVPERFKLEKEDKDFLKEHRVYIYRDDIRVYPYGDPTDDWLQLDISRGTMRAGSFVSNNQIVGYVGITSKENPELKDKTNREGLIDQNGAYEDMVVLVQSILGYCKTELSKVVENQNKKEKKNKSGDINIEKSIEVGVKKMFSHFGDKNDKKGERIFKELERVHDKHIETFKERIEITEDLAAVGLSVEMTSHDIIHMIDRSKEGIDRIIRSCNEDGNPIDKKWLFNELTSLRGQVDFTKDHLKTIQPLFRSSRRANKDIHVKDSIEKIIKYYQSILEKNKINIVIKEIGGPLVVNTNEAVLLQAFINLLDNSAYWLQTSSGSNKEIKIILNSNKTEVIFSDNGPGIRDDDAPYIFNEFFTTKGLKGRGLGLSIARRLLEKNDFGIMYLNKQTDQLLSGANFLINFNSEK